MDSSRVGPAEGSRGPPESVPCFLIPLVMYSGGSWGLTGACRSS